MSQLHALLRSDLLDESAKGFVEAALDAVYQEPKRVLHDIGTDVEAVESKIAEGLSRAAGLDVPFEPGTGGDHA